MGLIHPSPSGRCDSVPWGSPSHSLDVKRPYSSQGEATPHEEISEADVKGHNIWQAGRRQELTMLLKLYGFGVSEVVLMKIHS